MKFVFGSLLFIVCFSFSSLSQPFSKAILYTAAVQTDAGVKYEIYDHTGKKLFPAPVDWAYSNLWDWLFVRDSASNLIKVYNYDGTYLQIDSIEESKLAPLDVSLIALKRNGKWGYYNKSGQLMIPHQYAEASDFTDTAALVMMEDGNTFLIDTKGIKILGTDSFSISDYSFENVDIALGVYSFTSDNYSVVGKNKKQGLCNTDKKLVVPKIYDGLYCLKEHFERVIVEKNKKYGVVDLNGKIVIPILFDELYILNDYLAN